MSCQKKIIGCETINSRKLNLTNNILEVPLYCLKILASHNSAIYGKQLRGKLSTSVIDYQMEKTIINKYGHGYPNCIELDIYSNISNNIKIEHVTREYTKLPNDKQFTLKNILEYIRDKFASSNSFYPFIITIDTSRKPWGVTHESMLKKIYKIISSVFLNYEELLYAKYSNNKLCLTERCEQMKLKDLMNKILFRFKPLIKDNKVLYSSNITHFSKERIGRRLSQKFSDADLSYSHDMCLVRIYPNQHTIKEQIHIIKLNYSENFVNLCAFNFYQFDSNKEGSFVSHEIIQKLDYSFRKFYDKNNSIIVNYNTKNLKFDKRLDNIINKNQSFGLNIKQLSSRRYSILQTTALGKNKKTFVKKKRKKRKKVSKKI